MTIIRSTIAAAVAASACLIATPSFAADTSRETVRVQIRYADLDLSRGPGQAALKSRIDRAVRHACRSMLTGTRGIADTGRCRAEMLRDAEVKVAAIPARTPVELASRR